MRKDFRDEIDEILVYLKGMPAEAREEVAKQLFAKAIAEFSVGEVYETNDAVS